LTISRENTTLTREDGSTLRAYAARPADRPHAPGVVVIHEVWGVEAHIRSVVDRLAEAGYAAIAPDLLGMDVTIPAPVFLQAYQAVRQLSPEERAVPEKIAGAMATVPDAFRQQAKDLIALGLKGQTAEGYAGMDAAVRHLRAAGAPKIAVMGFCMGGAYVWGYGYRGAAVDALVPFYGRVPEPQAPEHVRAPLLGHYGALDQGIPFEAIAGAAEALRHAGHEATVYEYPNAGHAFFNEVKDAYQPEAAALAWKRTLEFLAIHLA
jgi:carboxymethylenebutenolidase